MGVPTSEVGYSSATARSGDHESSYEHVVALERERKKVYNEVTQLRKESAVNEPAKSLYWAVPLQCTCYMLRPLPETLARSILDYVPQRGRNMFEIDCRGIPPPIKCTTIIECTRRHTVNKLRVKVGLKLDLCSGESGSNLER